MALTLDEIQSTTQEFWYPKAKDLYYTGNILMYRLLQKAQRIPGGDKIRVVLHYGPPRGGAFGPNSVFDTNRYDSFNAARFDWAAYYEPCTYDLQDKIKNAGPQQEIDIVMTKLDMTQKAIKESMTTDLYSTGVAVGDEWPMTGLLAMINSTTSTKYGDIAQDDLALWAPGAVTTTSEAVTLARMRTLRDACQVGDGNTEIPTIYITTPALKSAFTALLTPQQRYEDADLAKVGFKNIEFEGVPVVSDMKCLSGYMFALNETYLDFRVHTDFDFHHEPWMRPTNQYKFTMQIIWAGNLVCLRRKAHGYHSNFS